MDTFKIDSSSPQASPRAPTNSPVALYDMSHHPSFSKYAVHAQTKQSASQDLGGPMNIAKMYPTSKRGRFFQMCDSSELMSTVHTLFCEERHDVRGTRSLQEITRRHNTRKPGNGLDAMLGKASNTDATRLAIGARKTSKTRKPINRNTVSTREQIRPSDAVVHRLKPMSKQRLAEVAAILGVEGKANVNMVAGNTTPTVTKMPAERCKLSAKLCTPEEMKKRHEKKPLQRLPEITAKFCIEGNGHVGLRKLPPTAHSKSNQR